MKYAMLFIRLAMLYLLKIHFEMKNLALLGIAAIMCVSTCAASAVYTFTPQAQRLVDKELGELIVRLYLSPESAYLQQTEMEQYKDLIIVVPRHKWELMARDILWQNVYKVLWPTLYDSFYGALIGMAAGGVLGLTAGYYIAKDFARSLMQDSVLGALVCGLGFVYVIVGLKVGVVIGAIIGAVVGFVYGLVSGIRKLFHEQHHIERCDGIAELLKEEDVVAVRFPVLADQLKQLAENGAELYVQVAAPGFSVI